MIREKGDLLAASVYTLYSWSPVLGSVCICLYKEERSVAAIIIGSLFLNVWKYHLECISPSRIINNDRGRSKGARDSVQQQQHGEREEKRNNKKNALLMYMKRYAEMRPQQEQLLIFFFFLFPRSLARFVVCISRVTAIRKR